ncbi:hypothetical protein BSKO_01360 [Bryopsis sp. KO-2023]|nr:hypothetical protein BSKO_01360 [Bryopsis sp. KO-2023]
MTCGALGVNPAPKDTVFSFAGRAPPVLVLVLVRRNRRLSGIGPCVEEWQGELCPSLLFSGCSVRQKSAGFAGPIKMSDSGDDDGDMLLSKNRTGRDSSSRDSIMRLDSKSRRSVCTIPKFVVFLATSALAIAALAYVDSQRVQIIVAWLKRHREDGAILFVLLGAAAVALLFPGTILFLSAGAVYGSSVGSILVWIANLVGQTAAFMVGRYIFRDFVVHHAVKRVPNFRVIDAAISKNAWKMILLLRLSPVVPFNLLNYALATTGISVVEFTVASAIGVIPWILVLVHVGAVARTAMGRASQGFDGLNELGWGPWTTFMWVMLSVVSVVGLGWYTKHAISQALATTAQEESLDEVEIVESSPDIEMRGVG